MRKMRPTDEQVSQRSYSWLENGFRILKMIFEVNGQSYLKEIEQIIKVKDSIVTNLF